MKRDNPEFIGISPEAIYLIRGCPVFRGRPCLPSRLSAAAFLVFLSAAAGAGIVAAGLHQRPAKTRDGSRDSPGIQGQAASTHLLDLFVAPRKFVQEIPSRLPPAHGYCVGLCIRADPGFLDPQNTIQ